ncbi:CGH_3_HP_G0042710.mRNA.1.CDS.1 [Saccharomyces cerevisiae]|nr:CGH_3_HP_G0042710.mRNA.1.CDS.1 [Saccharomyces cerevisiae]CAI4985573.1 CGH_1_HP_G0063010.mRNA.1.CDS.1 [Saccharomyces cerevisiae]CAI5013548.1 CGH_1_HP_G0002350.mRNA.1.CDS.1 [Saccharomyces cerevisiae]CAI5102540.1 CGH_1_HP_G0128370.mRNA.1.CDS.1 [Saccharomyces cerevisiae]CAI6577220.1 CGH_3_HP_G0042710.mRNA.1.CDS.1 [Saccharomyces cerevisiae]
MIGMMMCVALTSATNLYNSGTICDQSGFCLSPTDYSDVDTLCSPNTTFPCWRDEGVIIDTYGMEQSRLSKRSWWSNLWTPVRQTNKAREKWQDLINHCAACPKNGQECYGDLKCGISAITTVFSTAWAMYKWVEYVIKLQKGDGNIIPDFFYESGPLALDMSGASALYKRSDEVHFKNVVANMNGVPTYLLNMTYVGGSVEVSLDFHPDLLANASYLYRRDYTEQYTQILFTAGLKYSVCPVHPEHHLTVQYDWDDVWAQTSSRMGDLMGSYYNDIGAVDMNDYQQGGWRTLMYTGQLVLESSVSFGGEFETCDRNSFDAAAR